MPLFSKMERMLDECTMGWALCPIALCDLGECGLQWTRGVRLEDDGKLLGNTREPTAAGIRRLLELHEQKKLYRLDVRYAVIMMPKPGVVDPSSLRTDPKARDWEVVRYVDDDGVSRDTNTLAGNHRYHCCLAITGPEREELARLLKDGGQLREDKRKRTLELVEIIDRQSRWLTRFLDWGE